MIGCACESLNVACQWSRLSHQKSSKNTPKYQICLKLLRLVVSVRSCFIVQVSCMFTCAYVRTSLKGTKYPTNCFLTDKLVEVTHGQNHTSSCKFWLDLLAYLIQDEGRPGRHHINICMSCLNSRDQQHRNSFFLPQMFSEQFAVV